MWRLTLQGGIDDLKFMTEKEVKTMGEEDKIDDVGKMFLELHNAIEKIRTENNLTDEDFGAIWETLEGMPTAIRKMIA